MAWEQKYRHHVSRTHRKAQTVYVILKEQIHRNQSIHSSVYQTIYPLVTFSIHLYFTARQGSWLKYRQKSRDCLCKTFRKNTHESINRSYGIDRPIHQNWTIRQLGKSKVWWMSFGQSTRCWGMLVFPSHCISLSCPSLSTPLPPSVSVFVLLVLLSLSTPLPSSASSFVLRVLLSLSTPLPPSAGVRWSLMIRFHVINSRSRLPEKQTTGGRLQWQWCWAAAPSDCREDLKHSYPPTKSWIKTKECARTDWFTSALNILQEYHKSEGVVDNGDVTMGPAMIDASQ